MARTTGDRSEKASRGRTTAELTPVAIRSRIELGPRLERRIRASLGRKLGHAATLIERGTVRFEDVNGPKGGYDTVCRIKLVLSGRPSVIVEERATDPQTAFDLALPRITRVLEKTREKHDLAVGRRHHRKASRSDRGQAGTYVDPGAEQGSIIGRRVGRSPTALARALDRPEKTRRDAYVNTATGGVSETDRKAGGGSTARRNTKARTDRARAALEDSRGKPSRKSTRRSANRGKQSEMKEKSSRAAVFTPSARHQRARSTRRSVKKRR